METRAKAKPAWGWRIGVDNGGPRPPRVRVLIRRFHPIVGGMERQCAAICARLAAEGMAVEVWTRRIDPDAPPTETRDGYTVRRLRPGGIGRAGEYGGIPATILRLVADRARHDAVVVFGSGWLAVAAGLACRLTGRPWLFRPATEGDVTRFLDPAAGPTGSHAGRLARRAGPSGAWRLGILREAAAIVAVSGEIAAELRRWGFDAGRVAAIANGVDTVRFQPADDAARRGARAALGLPVDAVVVLFLGRLVARKGVLDLVAAWRTLGSPIGQVVGGTHAPAVLVVVGGGERQRDSVAAEVRAAVARPDDRGAAGRVDTPERAPGDPVVVAMADEEPGQASSIRLAGMVDDPRPWLAAADVFALPSHAEGLSNALLEAMASGLAVVASDIPANREALDADMAWWHPPGDVGALAGALRAALADGPGRARHGSASRTRAVDRFGLDGAARRYARLLATVVAGQRNVDDWRQGVR